MICCAGSRHSALSSLTGDSPPASSALSVEILLAANTTFRPYKPLVQHRTIQGTHPACMISRHFARKSSGTHQGSPAVFGQPDENSDCAICAPELCVIALIVELYHNTPLIASPQNAELPVPVRQSKRRNPDGSRRSKARYPLTAQSAALAFSARAVKAAGSWMASSESIFRFISTPLSFRPCMKVE